MSRARRSVSMLTTVIDGPWFARMHTVQAVGSFLTISDTKCQRVRLKPGAKRIRPGRLREEAARREAPAGAGKGPRGWGLVQLGYHGVDCPYRGEEDDAAV